MLFWYIHVLSWGLLNSFAGVRSLYLCPVVVINFLTNSVVYCHEKKKKKMGNLQSSLIRVLYTVKVSSIWG